MGIDEFVSQLSTYRETTLAGLLSAVPRREPQRHLYGPLSAYLSRSGKGIRPALCLATCRAFGGDASDALASATAIEMLHNAFLVHDDIEDESDLRRGLPTMHAEYGVPIAVNAGDMLTALSVRILRDNLPALGVPLTWRVYDEFDHMMQESLEGQAMELGWVRDNRCDITDEDYLRMVLKKTCWYSFIHPCRIGALIATKDRLDLDRFNRFGSYLGTAFQIQDDLLNLTGDERRYGKEIGGDLLEGKRTLMLIHLLRQLDHRLPRSAARRTVLAGHALDSGSDAIARQPGPWTKGGETARRRRALRVHTGVSRRAGVGRKAFLVRGHHLHGEQGRVDEGGPVAGHERQSSDVTGADGAALVRKTLDEAAGFHRRLIPFPGAEVMAPLSLLPLPARPGATPSNPLGAVMPDIVGDQAASIVSQAASILDEEMAKGVLAARRSASNAPYGSGDAGNPVWRQVHDFVDNIAAIWPSLQTPTEARSVPSPAASTGADPLAELRPRAAVRPGQRATISMTVCNSESRSVRLVAAVTDLLGSRGGRIASSLLECTPSEFSLEPREKRDLTIAMVVPTEAAPGCYSGLLVVKGVDYLRALLTIDVS
jgi:geranylgeranyl diphosphate synthase type II